MIVDRFSSSLRIQQLVSKRRDILFERIDEHGAVVHAHLEREALTDNAGHLTVLDFEQAFLLDGDLASDPVPPAVSPRRTGLADELGIRRVSVLREHRGITSGTLRTMRISLSKGDGSSGWTCDLPPLSPAWACRSPDGCSEHHVSDSV